MATNAERIKEAMRLRGLIAADLCRLTGIPKGTLSNYVTGKSIPKQKSIHAMATALNVSEAWIMGLDVPMERIHNTQQPVLSEKCQELIKVIQTLDDAQIDKVAKFIEILL